MKSVKNFREKLINAMVYGGITKQEYDSIKDEVLEKNRSSLNLASFCLVIMFSVLFLGSLVSEMMASNREIYGAIWLCFVVICVACQLIKRGSKWLIIPLWYMALSLIFAYAIILNTVIRNDVSATTFCAIMLAAPLLITDRPWRVFLYFSLVTLIFIPIDFQQKAYFLAYTDTVNALCCIFLGTVIHARVLHTKMREMVQKLHIETERDTDKLTGCLTKAAFERKMNELLKNSSRKGVLLVLDLDHFKSVNDTFGHVYGDVVLQTTGECLRQCFPDAELVGRFGGDEFQVWLPKKQQTAELTLQLQRFLAQIRKIETPDDKVKIASSIGVAFCPENGEKYSELFENADAALYSAKHMGRSRYVFCPQVSVKHKDKGDLTDVV